MKLLFILYFLKTVTTILCFIKYCKLYPAKIMMMNNIIHFSDSNKKKNPAELWIENRIYFSAIPSFVNGSMSVTFFNKTCHMA